MIDRSVRLRFGKRVADLGVLGRTPRHGVVDTYPRVVLPGRPLRRSSGRGIRGRLQMPSHDAVSTSSARSDDALRVWRSCAGSRRETMPTRFGTHLRSSTHVDDLK